MLLAVWCVYHLLMALCVACVSPSGSVTPENPHHETELKRHWREKRVNEAAAGENG